MTEEEEEARGGLAGEAVVVMLRAAHSCRSPSLHTAPSPLLLFLLGLVAASYNTTALSLYKH